MSGSLVVVGEHDFDDVVLGSPVPVLVDFFTKWCAPCKALAPTLEDLAEEYDDRVRIVSVDAEESPELAKRYDVTGYPTMVLVRDGEEIDRPQVRTRLQLREVLDQAVGVEHVTRAAGALPPDDGKIAPPVRRVLGLLDELTPEDWDRVTAFMTEVARQPSPEAVGAARELDEEAMTAALTRLQDDVEELAAGRVGADGVAQGIASAAAASFDAWVRQARLRPGWMGAFRAVPAVRMSPYLPSGTPPEDPAVAAADYVAALAALADDEWVQIRSVNRDVWPWEKAKDIGTNAWLSAVILIQAVTSAELVPTDVYEAAWEPFAGLLDRAQVEAA